MTNTRKRVFWFVGVFVVALAVLMTVSVFQPR